MRPPKDNQRRLETPQSSFIISITETTNFTRYFVHKDQVLPPSVKTLAMSLSESQTSTFQIKTKSGALLHCARDDVGTAKG